MQPAVVAAGDVTSGAPFVWSARRFVVSDSAITSLVVTVHPERAENVLSWDPVLRTEAQNANAHDFQLAASSAVPDRRL
jgi:hypothetical protein